MQLRSVVKRYRLIFTRIIRHDVRIRSKVFRASHVNIGIESGSVEKNEFAASRGHDFATLGKRGYAIKNQSALCHADFSTLVAGKRRHRNGNRPIIGRYAKTCRLFKRIGPVPAADDFQRCAVHRKTAVQKREIVKGYPYRAGTFSRNARSDAQRRTECGARQIENRTFFSLNEECLIFQNESSAQSAFRTGGGREHRLRPCRLFGRGQTCTVFDDDAPRQGKRRNFRR